MTENSDPEVTLLSAIADEYAAGLPSNSKVVPFSKPTTPHQAMTLDDAVSDAGEHIEQLAKQTAIPSANIIKGLSKQAQTAVSRSVVRPVNPKDFLDRTRRAEKQKEVESTRIFEGDILHRGDRPLMVVASSGVGKSTLILQEATLWTMGEGLLFKPGERLSVLILEAEEHTADYLAMFEGIERYAELNRIDLDHDEIEKRLTIRSVSGLTEDEIISLITEEVDASHDRGRPVDVVILNPVFGVFHGNASDQEQVSHYLRQVLEPLAKRPGKEFGNILVHHTPKPLVDGSRLSLDDAQYTAFGSAEWANASRCVVSLRKVDGTEGYFYAVSGKRRPPHWVDKEGKPTNCIIIAHARQVDEKGEPTLDRFWRIPDEFELEGLGDRQTKAEKQEAFVQECAGKVVDWFDCQTVLAHSELVKRMANELKITTNKDKIIQAIVKELSYRDILMRKCGIDKQNYLGKKDALDNYIKGVKDEAEEKKAKAKKEAANRG